MLDSEGLITNRLTENQCQHMKVPGQHFRKTLTLVFFFMSLNE